MSESNAMPTDVDPIERFREFFDEAVATGMEDPNAMVVSSVDSEGRPSSRVVLLKDFDADGFVFYTNLESRKGTEILANPNVSLSFFWREIGKQVVIRGRAEPVSDDEADAYFATRPRNSQLGAWASRQSRPLQSRAQLLARVAEYETKFLTGKVPRPPHWSGFRVVPSYIELWVAGAFRLHDRTLFQRSDGAWVSHKLNP